jgi:hypothetical protein
MGEKHRMRLSEYSLPELLSIMNAVANPPKSDMGMCPVCGCLVLHGICFNCEE